MKGLTILTLITTLYTSTTWPSPYFTRAEINLADLSSAKELAMLLPNLSQGLTLDGNSGSGTITSCEYTSKIRNSFVENDIYHIEVDFSLRGSFKACGDGRSGAAALWEILASTPKIKMEPIQKD